ncbi:MAG: recombination protein RecR [Acidobacteria bacterium]|nr:recombination protein RecR [Acidobacteriota bacterium]NIM61287.1 recombination protein RecR [Acidobacteriota bacterium]NIQ31596.1 recombination protein RecR [Acidobacteriota bacterium]NIQ86849.1 recombination protein RecR [Acidobacteriota bacterium]NIT12181.1 recombination protein RecR [Acidobacteriota bacterium]
MKHLAPPIERVVYELSKLPSVGRKTAQRLAFHLLKLAPEEVASLGQAILELRDKIGLCSRCFNLSDEELCPVCSDTRRDQALLCVVEEPTNLVALERTGVYQGVYHVLGGSLSPLKDVGPDELRIRELVTRIHEGDFREVILATNPNVEGEATAVYIARLLQPVGVAVTRLAQGLPAGGDLEYTDDLTLRRAMEGRRSY